MNVTGAAIEPREDRASKAVQVAITGTYAGTCVATAYMLTLVPNVEFFTMLVFMGGLLFGKTRGFLNGLVAATIYFIFNLYGTSPLPLLAVQLCAYSLLGYLGGRCSTHQLRRNISTGSQVVFASIGIAYAFTYTLVSDVLFSIIMTVNFAAWFLQGLPFTIVLVVTNAITFGLVMPLILVPVDKFMATHNLVTPS